MAIIIEAPPEIGPELLAHLQAQGLAATAPEWRNFEFGGEHLFQIMLAFSTVGLAEIVRYTIARYAPEGSAPEKEIAALRELTIVIDGEKVPIERLSQPGEIEKIAKERDEI
jgi:hypothetical protein